MKNGRIVRSLALIATASLVLGAFVAAPAEAKKKKKAKKPAACAPYEPGENGADAEITQVTDANTADAPAEVVVSTGPGLGLGRDPAGEGAHVSHAYGNLQVDSASSSALLNVSIEFAPVWDYDVYLDMNDGTEVANSAGFGNQTFGSDYAHSEIGSETIVAYPTSDCDGFTIDVVGATTAGGDVTVKYWLGEPAAE